jgi:hypothetical protein
MAQRSVLLAANRQRNLLVEAQRQRPRNHRALLEG